MNSIVCAMYVLYFKSLIQKKIFFNILFQMEKQDEKMNVTIDDPLKIEVKVEVNDYNPWS